MAARNGSGTEASGVGQYRISLKWMGTATDMCYLAGPHPTRTCWWYSYFDTMWDMYPTLVWAVYYRLRTHFLLLGKSFHTFLFSIAYADLNFVQCLSSWFAGGRSKRTCPDCRAPVKTQPAPAYLVSFHKLQFVSFDLTYFLCDRFGRLYRCSQVEPSF